MIEDLPPKLDDDTSSKNKIILQNGIAVSLLFIVVLLVTHIFRDTMMQYNSWIAVGYFAIIFSSVLFTQLQIREKTYHGTMSFGQAFGAGFSMLFLIALVFAVFNLIFYLFIAPDVLTEMKNLTISAMREKGSSEEDINAGIKMTGFMFSAWGIFFLTIIMYPVIGSILCLLTSAITQKSK